MRKHLSYHFKPPILASKTDKNIICLLAPLLGRPFYYLLQNVKKNGRSWDPFKIWWAPKRDQNSTKWRTIAEKKKDTRRFRDRLEKHKYMQKRLVDWTFLFSTFFLFLFSKSSGTAVKKYIIVSFVFGSATYIEKHRADEPTEIQ